MNILVTGASGFLGHNFINSIIHKEEIFKIIAVHFSNIVKIEDKKLIKLKLDVNSPQIVEIINKYKIDFIYHFAWANVSKVNSVAHIETELLIQINFFKNVFKTRVKKVIISGSCFEYGKIEGAIKSDEITNANTAYGIAKDSLRKWIELNTTISIDWCRIFYLYGDGSDLEKTLNNQLLNAIKNKDKVFNMSNGHQIRDFIHVKDACDQIYSNKLNSPEIFKFKNICSENPISVFDFVDKVLSRNNYNLKLNRGYYKIPDYEPLSFWGIK